MEWPWSPSTPLAAPASLSCKVVDVATRKILSWPLKLKWGELNRNSPPVMWHGVVGADDNRFLVVVTSRQKCPYNKFHFINRDLQSRENRKCKLPRPLQYSMTMSAHSSKRSGWKVGLDVEDLPLCLHLGVKCEKLRKMCMEKMSMKWKIGWTCKQENNANETRHNETKQEMVELVLVPAKEESVPHSL